MTKVDFYHLQKQTLEQVLPKLLEKAYETKNNVIVKIGNEERVEFLNSHLWTYDDTAFIPHGSKKDGFADQQPIWLTTSNDNPNQASMLFLVDGATASVEEISTYTRIFNIFDGTLAPALEQARHFWKELKAAEIEANYWQQDDSGRWRAGASSTPSVS